jgi:DNA-binding transcriptional MerR regulator
MKTTKLEVPAAFVPESKPAGFRFIFASHDTDSLHKALRGCAVRLHHRSRTTAAERGVVKNLISIGKFSKLTDLSVRTLRLYDELDVLKPAFIDPDTGYRSYRLDQVGTAHRIRAMRQLEMPLHAIRVVMGEPDRARDYLCWTERSALTPEKSRGKIKVTAEESKPGARDASGFYFSLSSRPSSR